MAEITIEARQAGLCPYVGLEVISLRVDGAEALAFGPVATSMFRGTFATLLALCRIRREMEIVIANRCVEPATIVIFLEPRRWPGGLT
jgi:hypothetical protein